MAADELGEGLAAAPLSLFDEAFLRTFIHRVLTLLDGYYSLSFAG